MMNYKLLSKLENEFKDKLVRSHVTNIIVLNSKTFIFISSYLNKEVLLVSLEPLHPYIYFVDKKELPLTKNNGLSQMLRHYVKDAYIYDIEVVNNDSIIRFKLRLKVDENIYKDYYLYIELIKKQTKLIITDSNNRILLSSHYTTDEERKVLINEKYNFPSNKIESNYDIDIDEYKKSGNKIYASALKKRKEEIFNPLFKHIDSKIKSLSKKLKVLNEEIELGKTFLSLKDYGDACLFMEKEEVYDMLNENKIHYDDTLSLIELSSYFFKKYKKGKAKISAAKEQIEKCNEEFVYYEYLKDTISKYSEEELDSLSFDLLKTNKEKRKNERIKNAKQPYKIIHSGVTILFGKNSEQNHNLTFHIANKDDTFLHIHNYPGSHIIIKSKTPTKEQLLLASSIALHLSNKTSGEIDYCKVSDVKSTSTTGLVILKKYNIIKLNSIDSTVKKLIENAKKV